jgi:hypothetical protein
LARLELALASREVTAIESDIIMAGGVPIMAHPPARASDLTFERFLNLVLTNGAKHMKLDFKVLEAVEPCLLMLAEVEERLRRNEQVECPHSRQAVGGACRLHCEPSVKLDPLALWRRRCGSTQMWFRDLTTGGPKSKFRPRTFCRCVAACVLSRSFRSAGSWHP